MSGRGAALVESMTWSVNPGAGRRPNAVAAFLLNLALPPLGYVYAGAMTAAATCTAALLLLLVATYLSFVFPPGVYALLGHADPYRLILPLYGLAGLGLGIHAAWLSRRPGAADGARPRRWLAGALLFAALPAAAAAAWAFAPISVLQVGSGAMEPTLEKGELVAVDSPRTVCRDGAFHVGDVVAFRRRGGLHIQRVVAGPGATVEVRGSRLYVDARAVPVRIEGSEPHRVLEDAFGPASSTIVREALPGGATYRTLDYMPDGELDDFGPVQVPAGEIFLLGDSRDNALDSRVTGTVPKSAVCGAVRRIVWSPDPARVGLHP